MGLSTFSISAEIFWAAAGVLATLATWALTELRNSRRQVRQLEERRWDQAILWARIIESDTEPDSVKAIARIALEGSGITVDVLREMETQRRARLVDALFSRPEPIETHDAETIQRAISRPRPEGGSELNLIIRYVWELEHAFERARASGRAEDDTRLRIFFVLVLFSIGFSALAIGAIRNAVGSQISDQVSTMLEFFVR